MQRYQAAELVRALDWPSYLNTHQVRWELCNVERADQELEPLPPLDQQAIKNEWMAWRADFIQWYALQGIVPPVDTVS